MQLGYLVAFYFWIALSGAIAVAAAARGRSSAAWFFISLIGSPLVAWAFLFAMPPQRNAAQQKVSADPDFPQIHKGVYYRVNPDKTVTVKTAEGQQTYADWNEFWQAMVRAGKF